MESGVFVLKDRETLVEMRPGHFASEDDFQRLLASFPALLSGDQIDTKQPRRWVLVKREKNIPSKEGGSGRWSVDHLFIDQDAIPTLVEVKRQTDTRIRREVVGQMLEYAANSVVYWPVADLRRDFEAVCLSKGDDPTERLASALALPDLDSDAFWSQVGDNLSSGKIRMLFVADRIPPELKRIVEFLNVQMSPAEVLAVELRQYVGEGLKTLVPIVFGQTEAAQSRKAVRSGPEIAWDREKILATIDERFGSAQARAASRLADWMQENASRVWYGKGTEGTMRAAFAIGNEEITPFILRTDGRLRVAFQLMLKGHFAEEAPRRELQRRLNEIPGVSIGDDDLTKRPGILLSTLVDERTGRLINVLDWFLNEVRAAP
jgi:hypothetical protein